VTHLFFIKRCQGEKNREHLPKKPFQWGDWKGDGLLFESHPPAPGKPEDFPATVAGKGWRCLGSSIVFKVSFHG